MVTILIADDEAPVRMLTKARLSPIYNIVEAADGEEALQIMDHTHVDLIIADIMMPKMDGYELVRALRETGDMTPVIMLTAMNTFAHKKEGFASGVDDYMTKPINYDELMWRIKALLRRAKIAAENRIEIGGFLMEQKGFTARYNGENITLTRKEFELLFKLLSYPGIVFTKQQLIDEIWGYDCETDYDAIKTYISRLRNKLSNCTEFELMAIRGLGYKAIIRGEEKK